MQHLSYSKTPTPAKVLISLIEIPCINHKIPSLKAHNSVIFLVYSQGHAAIPRHCSLSSPPHESKPTSTASRPRPWPHCLVSTELPVLNTPYNWDHPPCDLVCLACSLSRMFSRSIHTVQRLIVHTDHPPFTHSAAGGCRGRFYFLAIMNNGATNIFV